MKRKNLMLTAAAAAVLGAFNPAFAGGDAAYEKDSRADSRAPSGASADASADPYAEITPSAPDTTGAATGDSTAAADLERDQQQADKLTGLDRADQVAGDSGQQGRDNAREKQQDMN
jgi:hypothetical protein